MHIKQVTINGSSNIGLYGYVNDNIAILAESTTESVRDDVRAILDVPVHTTTVAGTNLVGAFVTGHNDTIIIPDIVESHEQDVFDDIDVDVAQIPTTYTCLGNNILVNDHQALVSPAFSEAETERIQDELQVETTRKDLAGLETVGTLAAFNDTKNKGVISNEVSDEEYAFIEDAFNTDFTPSSVNMGAAQIGCGVLCNTNGLLVGTASGGPELTTIDNGLGYNE